MTLVAPELAARVLERALARGGDMAELYAEAGNSFAISLDDGRVERPQSGRGRGACVRVVQGDSTYYGHVDGHAEDDLLRVAASVSEAVRGDARHPAELRAMESGARHPVETPPQEVEARRKADLLRACDERAGAAAPEVAQARIGYGETHRQVEVFGSDGRAARDDRMRIRLSAQVVARRDGRVETGTDTRGGHAGWELLGAGPEEVADKAARRALTLLDAVDAPTGRLPWWWGTASAASCSTRPWGTGSRPTPSRRTRASTPGASASWWRRSSSRPTTTAAANAWGSEGVDDEGTPTQRTTVIEEGRLGSYLYDLLRARKDGVESTGNGRRESFRHLPVPRMTNTFFAPGDATPDDLIGGVERGLYAVSFGGGQVEPATGDFVFGVSEGYLIESGRVTAPVRGATSWATASRRCGRSTGSRATSRSRPATAARPARPCRPGSGSRTFASASSPWAVRR